MEISSVKSPEELVFATNKIIEVATPDEIAMMQKAVQGACEDWDNNSHDLTEQPTMTNNPTELAKVSLLHPKPNYRSQLQLTG